VVNIHNLISNLSVSPSALSAPPWLKIRVIREISRRDPFGTWILAILSFVSFALCEKSYLFAFFVRFVVRGKIQGGIASPATRVRNDEYFCLGSFRFPLHIRDNQRNQVHKFGLFLSFTLCKNPVSPW